MVGLDKRVGDRIHDAPPLNPITRRQKTPKERNPNPRGSSWRGKGAYGNRHKHGPSPAL